MDRAAHAEATLQCANLTSKSSSRLRLSDDWSRVNLPNIDSPALSTRLADRKESSQIDVSEQSSDMNQTSKPRIPTNLTTSSSIKPDLQPISISTSLFLPAKPRAPVKVTSHGQQNPFLTILPHDVHYMLAVDYLDFDTLLALRQTCRTMFEVLNPELVRRVRSEIVQRSLDFEIQRFREYRSIYPRQRLGALWDLLYAAFDFRLIERPAKELRCYGCLDVKPLWCFVERMSNKGMGLGAKFARDRMCKDCMRRYRDIEGQWWKENWVKKSDTVRKASRGDRVKRWALEGQSLVNPEEEIGVCSSCGSGTFELWWGCVACFELEQKRRRDEDLEIYGGVERKIIDVVESWRARREAKRRTQQATRERRPMATRRWFPDLHFTLNWEGGLSERKARLLEWKNSKSQPPKSLGSSSQPDPRKTTTSRLESSGRGDGQPVKAAATRWRAIEQTPLSKNRREARCSSCWVPNCPRRTYILGLAYERPLPQEHWCGGCQHEFKCRHATKRGIRNQQPYGSSLDADGIFSRHWDGGFGTLFDET